MELKLIKNTDMSNRMQMAYQIARVVYATSGAPTLPLVEAFTSMIKNISDQSSVDIQNIISDSNLFPALQETNIYHERLFVPSVSRGFQMCLRTATRMLAGLLPDKCYGATKYHYANTIPDWALSRGYIADIDGILFYT